MRLRALSLSVPDQAPEAVLDAMFLPFEQGLLRLPDDGSVLMLRARDGFRLREMARKGWLCEQSFKPFADALEQSGLSVGEADPASRYRLVLVLPPRQRDEARALFARAAMHAQGGGVVLACVPNAEGAKSAEGDLARLLGTTGQLSKHKCRVFWGRVETPLEAHSLWQAWLALDQVQRNPSGWYSRPGLFAWDRVDAASALLAEHLPVDLTGAVADLGAGYGYLSAQVLARCPGVTSIDLFEAEARALEPARRNLEQALRDTGRDVPFALHWHDVAAGITQRFDAVVSNPPFHQGRADLPELGQAFIARAAQALRPEGRLLLVANRHLPYEAELTKRFHAVRSLALQDGFKVIEARGVRA